MSQSDSQEQLFHELEQRHILLRKEHTTVLVDRDCLKARVEELEKVVEEYKSKIDTESTEIHRRDSEIKIRDGKIKSLEDALDKTNELFSRKCDECNRLTEDVNTQVEQIKSLQTKVKDSSSKLYEYESQLIPREHEISKLSLEKDNFQKKSAWLEQELAAKTAELYETRRQSSEKVQELEGKLAQLTRESTDKATKIASLEDQLLALEERSIEYLNKIKRLEIDIAHQQNSFTAEIDAQKRLVDLYKLHVEEATSKVEQLESAEAVWRDAHQKQIAQFKARLEEDTAKSAEIIKSIEDKATAKITELNAQIDELKKSAANRPNFAVVELEGDNSSRASNVLPVDFNSLSVAEMFDRVAQAEKALIQEQCRRKELELYLDKILSDIEKKTPIIASQKREYTRIVESHNMLTEKINVLISENSALKMKLHESEQLYKTATIEIKSLTSQNIDLGSQVQHLLKNSIEGKYGSRLNVPKAIVDLNNTDSIIDAYLLNFDDIVDLQTKNIQLLQVVRKLSEDLSSEKSDKIVEKSNENSEALRVAIEELSSLRESRQRMEEMVASLVQQRDIYRTMLEEAQIGFTASNNHVVDNSKGQAPTTPLRITDAPSESTPLKVTLSETQLKLAKSEEELSSAKVRIAKLEMIEKSLMESIDKHKTDIATLRGELSVATGEASFQKDRVKRLEEGLKHSQQELQLAANRRSEIEGLLLSQQKESRSKEEFILQMQDSIKLLQEKLRSTEVKAEVSAEAEKRLNVQLAELREEMKKQVALVESISRIENSLISRSQTEKEALANELQSVTNSYEKLKKDFNEEVAILQQKLQSSVDEVRIVKASLESKVMELSSIRESFAREQATNKALSDRSALLEKQLDITQNRLTALQGSQVNLSILTDEATQRDLEHEKLIAERDSLAAQLKVAEGHVEQFKKIGTTTEHALNELKEKFAASRVSSEAEIQKLKQDIESMKIEINDRRQAYLQAVEETDNVRQNLTQELRTSEETVNSLVLELQNAQTKETQLLQNMEVLKSDAENFQRVAREAVDNYERELQLHAKAAAELRKVEEVISSNRKEIASYVSKIADLSGEMLKNESLHTQEKTNLQSEIQQLKEELSNYKRTNDLLHGQIQTLSTQVNRLNEEKFTSIDITQQSTQSEESAEVRRSLEELREVLKYMKREKDSLEARLQLAESEKQRLITTNLATQRSLDESRAELNKQLERYSQTRSEEEFIKLMSEITQLNVVRESNAHLRAENEEMGKQRARLENRLQELQGELAPLKEKNLKLESARTVLEQEKVALATDATYWKDRLHQLVSRYNDVDPEDHRALKEQLAEMERKLEVLKAEYDATTAKLEEQVKTLTMESSTKDTELVSLRSANEVLEKTGESLRTRLREFTKSIKDLKTQVNSQNAELTNLKCLNEALQGQLDERVKAHQDEVASLKSALDAAKSTLQTAATTIVQQVAPSVNSQPPSGLATTTPVSNVSANQKVATLREEALRRMAETKAKLNTAPSVVTPAGNAPTAEQEIVVDESSHQGAIQLIPKKARPASVANLSGQEVEAVTSAIPSDDQANQQTSKRVKIAEIPVTATNIEGTEETVTIAVPAGKKPRVEPKTTIPCLYYNTPQGCIRGDQCKFLHIAPAPVVQEEKKVVENMEVSTDVAASGAPVAVPEESQSVDLQAEETKRTEAEDVGQQPESGAAITNTYASFTPSSSSIFNKSFFSLQQPEQTQVPVTQPTQEVTSTAAKIDGEEPQESPEITIETAPVAPSTPFMTNLKPPSPASELKPMFGTTSGSLPLPSGTPTSQTSIFGEGFKSFQGSSSGSLFAKPNNSESKVISTFPSSTSNIFGGFNTTSSTLSTPGAVPSPFGIQQQSPFTSPFSLSAAAKPFLPSLNQENENDDNEEEYEGVTQPVVDSREDEDVQDKDDVEEGEIGETDDVGEEDEEEHEDNEDADEANRQDAATQETQASKISSTSVTMTPEQRRLVRFARFQGTSAATATTTTTAAGGQQQQVKGGKQGQASARGRKRTTPGKAGVGKKAAKSPKSGDTA